MILLFSHQAPLKFNNDVSLIWNLDLIVSTTSQHFQRFQLGGKYSQWQTLHQ